MPPADVSSTIITTESLDCEIPPPPPRAAHFPLPPEKLENQRGDSPPLFRMSLLTLRPSVAPLPPPPLQLRSMPKTEQRSPEPCQPGSRTS